MCVFIPHLLYPFICRLALRMFLSMFKQHFFKILAVLDLHCCTGFSLVVSGGSSLVAVHWLLIVVSSLVVEHGLQHAGFSRYSIWVQQLWPQALDRWLSSCGALVQSLCMCRSFPGQGLNPCLPHWQADSLPLSHQESPKQHFLKPCLVLCISFQGCHNKAQLGGLTQRKYILSPFWRPEVRSQSLTGLCYLQRLQVRMLPRLFLQAVPPRVPWFAAASLQSLPLSSQAFSFLCLCLYVFFPFLTRTPKQIGFKAHLNPVKLPLNQLCL